MVKNPFKSFRSYFPLKEKRRFGPKLVEPALNFDIQPAFSGERVLLVVSWAGKKIFFLSLFAPEKLVPPLKRLDYYYYTLPRRQPASFSTLRLDLVVWCLLAGSLHSLHALDSSRFHPRRRCVHRHRQPLKNQISAQYLE